VEIVPLALEIRPFGKLEIYISLNAVSQPRFMSTFIKWTTEVLSLLTDLLLLCCCASEALCVISRTNSFHVNGAAPAFPQNNIARNLVVLIRSEAVHGDDI
jgi:hypothetical protein